MDEKFDCIIVGGGIAGLSAAMVLARAGARFLLIERGEFCGSKNVSGGVLWGTDLARLVPNYWEDEDAGFERFVGHRRLTFMDEQSAFSLDFKSSHFAEPPHTGITVLRARFDNWLAAKVEEALAESTVADESFLVPNVLVEEVLKDGDRVVGIRAGDESFYADCVILAEGINNLLTRQIGLQADYVPADYVAVGVKEVIRFDRSVLEDRFQLSGRGGLSNEFVGYASRGVEGGGFLYTNLDSVSIGLVLGMKDLREKGAPKAGTTPYDFLNDFKMHPAMADMLRGGEVIEYSAHVVSTGDLRGMPREIYDDGVLVAGEAAGLLLNSGKAIQGMDYAMRSGILAAGTVIEAKRENDFSAATLKAYRVALEDCFVLQDLQGFQQAVHLLHSPEMFSTVPDLVCDFGRSFFTITGEPARKASVLFRESVRRHTTLWELAKLGYKARSL